MNSIKIKACEIEQKIIILETLYDKELGFELSLKVSDIIGELIPKKEWYTKQIRSIYDKYLEKNAKGEFVPVFEDTDNPSKITGYKVLDGKSIELMGKMKELNEIDILLDCNPIYLSEFKSGIGKNQIKPKDLYNLRMSFIKNDITLG